MIRVTIPIYFKSEQFNEYESMTEELGIEMERPDISESEIRDITFYKTERKTHSSRSVDGM